LLTLYYFLGFGLSGFAVGWILLRQITRVPYWRRLSRRTAHCIMGTAAACRGSAVSHSPRRLSSPLSLPGYICRANRATKTARSL